MRTLQMYRITLQTPEGAKTYSLAEPAAVVLVVNTARELPGYEITDIIDETTGASLSADILHELAALSDPNKP